MDLYIQDKRYQMHRIPVNRLKTFSRNRKLVALGARSSSKRSRERTYLVSIDMPQTNGGWRKQKRDEEERGEKL